MFHVKHDPDESEQHAASTLQRQTRQWGVALTLDQVSLLAHYAELLAGYQRANVIGPRDRNTVLLEHVTDALSCLLTGQIKARTSIVDVGTGGGIPGIPLRIAHPTLRLTLLEATAKKTRFLTTVVSELGLRDVEVVNQRAEAVGNMASYRESFDVAVARAVAALPVVVEYCAPLVRAGGTIIAMKARPSGEELSAGAGAAKALGAELETVYEVEFTPEMVQKDRTLIVFRKTAATPKRFPRRVGLAKQRPLGRGR